MIGKQSKIRQKFMKTRNLDSVARSHLLKGMKTDKYAIEGVSNSGIDRFGEV